MKILLIGNGSPLNRGCQAILDGSINILRKNFPDANISNYFFSHNNELEYSLIKDESYEINCNHEALPVACPSKRFSLNWVLSNMSKSGLGHRLRYLAFKEFQDKLLSKLDEIDFALQLGGDNYSLDYGFPLLHVSIDQALASRKIPIALWGASVGPFSAKPRIEKWMTKHFDKYIRLILVREPDSYNYLKSIGIKSKLASMSDPAFVMESLQPDKKKWNHAIPNNAIGINLSPIIGRYRKNPNLWLKEAVDLLKGVVLKFDCPIFLLPHVTSPGNDDYLFMKNMLEFMEDKLRDDILIVPPVLNARELKWIISKLNILIAARTHATIAGFSSTVPTISIAYSMKAYGLNQKIFNHHRYVVHAKDLTDKSLISRIEKTITESEMIKDHLAHICFDLRAAAYRGGDILESSFLKQKIT